MIVLLLFPALRPRQAKSRSKCNADVVGDIISPFLARTALGTPNPAELTARSLTLRFRPPALLSPLRTMSSQSYHYESTLMRRLAVNNPAATLSVPSLIPSSTRPSLLLRRQQPRGPASSSYPLVSPSSSVLHSLRQGIPVHIGKRSEMLSLRVNAVRETRGESSWTSGWSTSVWKCTKRLVSGFGLRFS